MRARFTRSFLTPASLLAAALALGTIGGTAHAQSYEQAVSEYKSGNFEDSATLFYSILRFEDDPGVVAESQFGLAKSFDELGLYLAALKYYEDIVKEGSDHPYFEDALSGLLNIADKIEEDLKIPPIIDAMYEPNSKALRKMMVSQRGLIDRIHFVIGRYSFNRGNMQDARSFLKSVSDSSAKYPHAQYILGLIRLGVGRPDSPAPKYDEALEHFENVRRTVPITSEDQELRRLRDLSTLGIGRLYYERAYLLDDGNPERTKFLDRAVVEYKRIPRFSEAWPNAIFERAWAQTVSNDYGKALGTLHNLDAPFFEDYFFPEANILKSIVYYYNCHWDRVNATVEETKAEYGPLVTRMEALAEKDYAFEEWYSLLMKSLEAGKKHGDPELIPYVVAAHIERDPKFQKLQIFLSQLEKEGATFESNQAFSKGEVGREMVDFALETREAFLKVVGRYVKSKFIQTTAELSDITTRASIVSLETKTAETEWLEQGRTIEGAKRGRLPRPAVPDDTFEYWVFRDEFWIDELGYYEAVIKSECYEL